MTDGFERLGDVAIRVVDNLDHELRINCLHHRTQIRRKINVDGRPVFKRQCLNCGAPVGEAVARAKVPTPYVEWDEAAENALQESYDKHYKQLELDRRLRNEAWWDKYTAYLASDEWARKRERVLARDSGLCQACRKRPATQVHHLTYDHVFSEPLFDLTSVCGICHEALTIADRERRGGALGPNLAGPNEEW